MLVVEQLKPKRHNRDGFTCGEPTLDAYLRQQAAQHHRDGISTTHVLLDDAEPARILGYYSLSAAQLLLTDLQEADRKRLPAYPVPAIRMGRLAVDQAFKGQGLGGALLADALHRAVRSEIAAYAMVVDAKDDAAAAFYQHHGFIALPDAQKTLFLPLAIVQGAHPPLLSDR